MRTLHKNMKNALFISANSYSLLHFRRALIKSLIEENFSIAVCCPPDANIHNLKEDFEKLNVKIITFDIENTSKNIFLDIKMILNLIKIIKTNNVNYIFSYHMKPVVYGSIVAYFLGLKHIYSTITGLGYMFTESKKGISISGTLLKKFLTFALLLNEKIFFQNKDDFNFLCKNKKLRSSSVLVNGSGVDTHVYRFTPPPQEVSFLFVGRLLTHKGLREYVEASQILKKKYPTVSFKVAGGFHSNPSAITKKELENWINEGSIDYIGEVREMLPVFQNSSVCVLPSYREGCPRSLLEAMAVGRAIITTDAPGCRDTVIENENGYLVPVKSINELIKAMEKFIVNPTLIKKMGKKSRHLAEKKYDVDKVNEMILTACL